ncbi:putative adenosinetriphosphatase [Helianthus annuus]|nr:putative adenosinetriphosphatase [Helianthus annuus]
MQESRCLLRLTEFSRAGFDLIDRLVQFIKPGCLPLIQFSSREFKVSYALRSLLNQRNARLMQLRSSIYQKIWIKIQLIVMGPTPSNCIGSLSRGLGKFSVIDRNVGDLSGGELQRFAIAVVAIQNAEIFMFDEPSSYLDVKQRLKAAQVIRSLLRPNSYVIVVEHDLSVLDYLSDFICCLYRKPGAYGVVTLPFSVREGINIFLEGYVPTENLRFRDESLTFKTPQESAEEIETYARYKYPTMSKTQGGFKLKVVEGEFTDFQIIVMLGENGTGKTTFIRMLAGILKPDTIEGSETEIPEFNVSYKPQKISPKFPNSVRRLLHQKIRDSYMHPQFVSDSSIFLSGGELQRVALCLCLGKPADIYLIDEPSAYLDSEQRIVASKVIKRFILHAKKTAFVVEHDFIMATYLADRVIVYEGTLLSHPQNPHAEYHRLEAWHDQDQAINHIEHSII